MKLHSALSQIDLPGKKIRDSWDPRLPVRYTRNKLYLLFNRYRDIRANNKCQKD